MGFGGWVAQAACIKRKSLFYQVKRSGRREPQIEMDILRLGVDGKASGYVMFGSTKYYGKKIKN